jgi:hypothetical protein
MDLQINETKCKSLTIKKSKRCDDIHIPGVVPVATLNILGVIFNARCNWTSHFDNVIKNASRRFYALRLLRPSLTNLELKMVYSALVRSVIEYCCPLFLGMTSSDKKRLERLQKRFHKMLCGQYCDAECLIPLEDRRIQLSLKFLEKMKNKNHILHHILPPPSSTGRFILPSRFTNRRSHSFIPLVCEISNSLFNR